MKMIKYLSMAAVAVFATACHEEGPDYEMGPTESKKSMKVSFKDAPKSLVLALEENEFIVPVSRENATNACEVPFTLHYTDGVFKADKFTLSFAEGEATDTITITAVEMESFVNYKLNIELELDSMQSNFYGATATAPQHILTVLKEDYKPAYAGTYVSWLFGEFPMIMEYSEMLDAYRLSGLYADGYNYVFSPAVIDENGTLSEDLFCVSSGSYNASAGYVSQQSGFVHESYGMIYTLYICEYAAEDYYYNAKRTSIGVDADGNLVEAEGGVEGFLIYNINYQISAGSFGQGNEAFVIEEKL